MKATPRLILPREQDIILDPDRTAELTARLDVRQTAILEHLGKYALSNPAHLIGGTPEIMVPVRDQCGKAIIDVLDVVGVPLPRREVLDAIEDHWEQSPDRENWGSTAYHLTPSGMLSIAMMRLQEVDAVRFNRSGYTVELVSSATA